MSYQTPMENFLDEDSDGIQAALDREQDDWHEAHAPDLDLEGLRNLLDADPYLQSDDYAGSDFDDLALWDPTPSDTERAMADLDALVESLLTEDSEDEEPIRLPPDPSSVGCDERAALSFGGAR